jgi:autotransporter translocation and assembly factor TamB
VEILFAKGDISLAGSLPLTLEPMSVGPPDAPLSLTLQAEGIDLASFTSLLPGDSRLAGLVDGEVSLEGNAGNPSLNGSLGLRNGFFQSPFERTALTNVNVELAMSGKELRVQNLRANAGSGTLASDGTIMLNDLAHPLTKSAYDFKASVRHAELDLPQYGKGVLDADLALHASAGSTPLLSGTATLANATIPFSALALPMGNSPDSLGDEEAISALPNLDLDLNLTAASNVRVRSGNLDLGGTGQIHVAGNLQEPHLEGGFTSTGGTITYFNSSFRVLGGTLKFTPDLGLIPTLDAQAVTTVRNPAATLGDRNVSVDLGVHGPVTDLSVDLQSDPPYPRDQILAFLVGTPTAGVVMSGLNGSTTNSSPSTSVGGELFGLLDAQFTRTLLSPLETKVSGALGLSNIDLALGYGGDVGLTARKLLGRRMQAFYSSGFTYPYRQTFGLEFNATALTVAKLSFYESTTQLAPGSALASTLSATNVSSPAFLDTSTGTNGFAFSLERHF